MRQKIKRHNFDSKFNGENPIWPVTKIVAKNHIAKLVNTL